MPTLDTTPADARPILTNMRRLWQNTRYQTEMELKIQSRLKQILQRDVSEAERSLLDHLREVEIAISLLDEELAALPAE